MSDEKELNEDRRFPEFEAIASLVHQAALAHKGDSYGLLALLRLLEDLHRDIRDGLFQASLPDNRQALYNLLRDIETKGGWPYIPRMKLQAFFAHLAENESVAEATPQSEKNSRPVNEEIDRIEVQ